MSVSSFKRGTGKAGVAQEAQGKVSYMDGKGTDQAGSLITSTQEVDSITEEVSTKPTVSDELAGGEYSDDRIREYYEFLKTKDITDEDLISVLDTLVTSGSVKWAFQLFNKINVEMAVRPAWVNTFILGEVERVAPKTFARFTDLTSIYNLAGSLVKYGDQSFSHETEEEIKSNYQRINKLSFIIQNKLIQQLAVFDRLLAVATSDWALENFTEPQSEN